MLHCYVLTLYRENDDTCQLFTDSSSESSGFTSYYQTTKFGEEGTKTPQFKLKPRRHQTILLPFRTKQY